MLRRLNNLSITVKAFAASTILAVCLIVLGFGAFVTLKHWARGVEAISHTSLPEQHRLHNIRNRLSDLQLNIFRYVAWSNNAVNDLLLARLRSHIDAELAAIGTELRSLAAHGTMQAQDFSAITRDWAAYSKAAQDSVDIARADPPMGTMMLGVSDDRFKRLSSALAEQSDKAAEQVQLSTETLAIEATRDQQLFGLIIVLGILVGFSVAALIARSIAIPIRAVTDAMKHLARGETAHEIGYRDRQDEVGEMLSAISTFRDNTERDNRVLAERERQLLTHNIRFDAAINNMSQGLAMFDRDRNLIVCNARYAELYRLPPELMKAGTTQRQVLEHRVAAGIYDGKDPQKYISARVGVATRGVNADSILELTDGRVISVSHRAMPDGGWVSTHEDITERRRVERERDQSRAFLNAVLESVPVTIVAKEVSSREYIFANRAAEELWGLSRDQVIGKTAYAIFSKDAADRITARDEESLIHKDRLLHDTLEVEMPRTGRRLVASRRIALCNDRGEPTHLIRVVEDVTESARAAERVAYMAHHDLLTGLVNRVLFMDKIEEASARQRRRGEAFAIFMLDLDRFKEVNDSLGHAAGDTLLVEAAGRLNRSLRETDVLARLGGDEFAIIQPNETHQSNEAAGLADRIIKMFLEPFDIDGTSVTVGVSIGIALAPADGSEPHDLIKKADLALYRTKAEGRNGYTLFDPKLAIAADTRHQLERDLREALSENRLEVHYQPIFDAITRRPCGVEALARWPHPQKGFVPPSEFIPLAEETGLIVPIGRQILRRACMDAASWPPHVKVSINLSLLQFKRDNLLDVITRALAESGLPPTRLELEITETMLIERHTEVVPVVHQLKNLGIAIVLDDFGTGYSSLSYLTKLPFDKIKIDKFFTQNLARRAECAAIISAVRAIGESLNITIVAEGVETEEQLALLRASGVTLVQGYLLGRPQPACQLSFCDPLDARPVESAA